MDLSLASQYLGQLPAGFDQSIWAHYSTQKTAAIIGDFNRTALEAPWEANATDSSLRAANDFLNTTDFVAFDPSFFNLIGSEARVEHVWDPANTTIHEASCFIPALNSLYFASWGFSHDWQFLLNATTNEVKQITTDPPVMNAHGCQMYNGSLYITTDGGEGTYASVVKVDPLTWKSEVILNNFYQQPFQGFNDLDIDPQGNIWMTDSSSAWSNALTDFAPATSPAVYFLNMTTRAAKWLFESQGNVNGIAYGPSGTLYVDVTDISSGRPKVLDPTESRALWSFDTRGGRPQLHDQVLFSNPISRYYDGVRVSRNGYVWAASGDGLDVIEPVDGTLIGRVRVGGGAFAPVNVAFEDHVLWIVGKGGVWKVDGVKERLARDW
ncbi:unnamed protein product [Zymoseptoria tritici ST99CH_3D1]|uniref:SMP-30/Gluconolactonase/LRE-like region domain-containing protein n=2 Tax=Zymoseptoria tritici TaxID=1047171 RepID=A0A1X7RGH1_ZYMT9|nr:unnamed protein product [Zymoseptoria tritici ST99CH_3D7]SMR42854.1 unnamed protein product [Zymoseptoria tritici ST99CH_1E4]SMR45024.1 unnamed protein product [Zymoseptoria tritici ST99CH_3D1]